MTSKNQGGLLVLNQAHSSPMQTLCAGGLFPPNNWKIYKEQNGGCLQEAVYYTNGNSWVTFCLLRSRKCSAGGWIDCVPFWPFQSLKKTIPPKYQILCINKCCNNNLVFSHREKRRMWVQSPRYTDASIERRLSITSNNAERNKISSENHHLLYQNC